MKVAHVFEMLAATIGNIRPERSIMRPLMSCNVGDQDKRRTDSPAVHNLYKWSQGRLKRTDRYSALSIGQFRVFEYATKDYCIPLEHLGIWMIVLQLAIAMIPWTLHGDAFFIVFTITATALV